MMRNILSQSAGSGNRDFHHRGLRVPGEILSENNDRTYLKADCPKSLIMTVIHGPVRLMDGAQVWLIREQIRIQVTSNQV